MRRNGFTLVELMVVIAVIALVLGMVLPSMSSVAALGRETLCKGNLNRLGGAFTVAANMGMGTGTGAGTVGPGVRQAVDIYPKPMSWPTIPRNAVGDQAIYLCPEAPPKEGAIKGGLADMFSMLEYECEQGRFPLNILSGEGGSFYKSRTGEDPSKGGYTDYLLQDDMRSNGQFDKMSFNGWIDTDGVIRVWHSGNVLVYDRIPDTPEWAYTNTTHGGGPGRPSSINTCGNENVIRWRGDAAWKETGGSAKKPGAVQAVRGRTMELGGWIVAFTNYAISSAARKYAYGSKCVVLLDANQLIADVAVPKQAYKVFSGRDSARHLGRVNYLRGDGSVKSTLPATINPIIPANRAEYWTPGQTDLDFIGQ